MKNKLSLPHRSAAARRSLGAFPSRLFPLLMLAVVVLVRTAAGQGIHWLPPAALVMGAYVEPSEDTPASLALGQFNKDRAPDLLALCPGPDALFTRLNNGAGMFATPLMAGAVPPVAGAQFAIRAVADFNQDGRADVLLELDRFDGTHLHSLRLGDGSGKFKPAGDGAVPAWARAGAAGEFTGDGKMDLLVSDDAGGQTWILPGDGKGRFGLALPTGMPAGKHVAADCNQDGRLDVLVSDGAMVSVWLRGNGPGFVHASSVLADGGVVAAEDFNRRGRLSFVVVQAGRLVLASGTGDGAFVLNDVTPTELGGGSFRPESLITGDFNGDGWPDLAVRIFHEGTYRALVLTGHGTGPFVVEKFLPTSGPVLQMLAGDLNQDGLDEVVVGQVSGANFVATIFSPGRTTPPVRASVESSSIEFDHEEGNEIVFKARLTLAPGVRAAHYRQGNTVTVAPTFSFADFYLADWTYPYLWNVTVKDIKTDQETWMYTGTRGEKLVIKWKNQEGALQLSIPDDALPVTRQPRTARVDLEINPARLPGHTASALSGQTVLRITRDDPYASDGSRWTYPAAKR